MTENGPKVLEKNFYIEGEEHPSLQYVIKHEGKAYIIRVPLKVEEDRQVKVIDSPGNWITVVYVKTTKEVKSTHDNNYKQVVHLTSLNYYKNRHIYNNQNYEKYNLKPVVDLFYKIAPKDIKEYNTNIVFGSEKETQDTFGDLFNEI